MAAGADFRSRITLEGGDKIVTDLQRIGTEGDKAFNTVGKAADQSTSSVNSFARATESLSRSISAMRGAASEASRHFTNIGKSASEFGGALNNMANRIIPHWQEIVGLATVGGAAGFVKLFEATAKWGHELAENARLLGLHPGEFQQIAKAAKEAGVDVDTLTGAMLRFGKSMEVASDQRKKLFGDLAKEVLGANRAAGGPTILRGGQAPGAAQDDSRMKIVPRLENFREQAEEAYAVLRKIGAIPQETTLSQWLNEVQRKLMAGGEAAAKIREMLNKAGADLPARTLGEQIDKSMPGFRDLFAQLKVPVFDKATGDVRKLTDVFGDFLDKFKNLTPAEQARIVLEKMGRGALDLIPIMQKGRDGLLKFFDAAKAAGVDTSAFDKEIESLDEANRKINKLNASIAGVRKSFVVPFADVFTPIFDQIANKLTESQPAIKTWATGIAQQAEVVAKDLVAVWQGAEPKTDFGKGFLEVLNAISVAVGVVSAAFGGLTAVLQPVADVLNAVFGTDYSAKTYALAAAMLYFSGILPALAAGLKLVGTALAFITANPIGLALAALAAIALTIYQNWDTIWPVFQALWENLQSFGQWLSDRWVKFWTDPIQGIKDQWAGLFNWLAEKADQAWQKLKSLNPFGGAAPVAEAPIPQRMATGGSVPGSGNGDTVPALLTPGEFVMRRAVVDALGAPFFAALNGGMGSFLPRTRFATGGIVAPGAAGTPVHLHIGGQQFALAGASNVVSALVVEAHRQHVRSAGVKPSWYGGR